MPALSLERCQLIISHPSRSYKLLAKYSKLRWNNSLRWERISTILNVKGKYLNVRNIKRCIRCTLLDRYACYHYFSLWRCRGVTEQSMKSGQNTPALCSLSTNTNGLETKDDLKTNSEMGFYSNGTPQKVNMSKGTRKMPSMHQDNLLTDNS